MLVAYLIKRQSCPGLRHPVARVMIIAVSYKSKKSY
jgi:hypothetical protein